LSKDIFFSRISGFSGNIFNHTTAAVDQLQPQFCVEQCVPPPPQPAVFPGKFPAARKIDVMRRMRAGGVLYNSGTRTAAAAAVALERPPRISLLKALSGHITI
jgi:hypothetical protein